MSAANDQFDNLPFTRRELLEQVQGQVNRPIVALFWTGSRVNGLAQPDSDYDVLAITNVTNEDLLSYSHYRKTVKSKIYNKNLEIKAIDIVSLYQSLSKGNWILLEALSQRSISTEQYFQPLFDALSDSSWLISSCPARYAKAAIGQSLFILAGIRRDHHRWRHDIYYIVKFNNYLQQFIDHPATQGNIWHLTTKDLKDVQLARHTIANHELKDLTPDQAYPVVQDLVNKLKDTANQFEQVYQNCNTQPELTELFSRWVFSQRNCNCADHSKTNKQESVMNIKLNGTVLILDQNAFMTAEGDAFCALAYDADENKYMIRWNVLPDWDGVDGGSACDWDNPAGAVLIEKGHVALVDEDAIDALNEIAREGVQVLKPGELRDWLADMAESQGMSLLKYVDQCTEPAPDIIEVYTGDAEGLNINNCIPVAVDDTNLDGVYSIKALGDTPSRELFSDRIKADQLIANVPLYDVTVDGKQIYTLGDGFHWDDGELLWQAMSEELTDLVPDGDEDRLTDWQNLPDDDIETLLQSAKEAGFISDYSVDEAVKISN